MRETVRGWAESGSFATLLQLWVRGLSVEWKSLYGEGSVYGSRLPRRVSLPSYPFAKIRHYVDLSAVTGGAVSNNVGQTTSVLHPLVHANTSSFSTQQFTSRFTGEEPVLADHWIDRRKSLPAVCYLEMAHAAVELSLDPRSDEALAIELRHILWMQPLVVSGPQEVHVRLDVQESEEIEFEICSAGKAPCISEASVQSQSEAQAWVTHAQGRAVVVSAPQIQRRDISALRSRCTGSVEVEQCYARLASAGIEYGSTYRGLRSLSTGKHEDGSGFVLAQVRLPDGVADEGHRYVLHPSALGCALQAASFIEAPGCTRAAGCAVPVSLQKLELLDHTPEVAWVIARKSDADSALDIEICDESGRVCVRLRGLILQERAVAGESSASKVSASPAAIERLLFQECWQEQAIETVAAAAAQADRPLVVLLSGEPARAQVQEALRGEGWQSRVIFVGHSGSCSESEQSIRDTRYEIQRGDVDSYAQVFARIGQAHGEICGLWYLWPLEDAGLLEDQCAIVELLQGLGRSALKHTKVLLAGEYTDSPQRCQVESWIGYARSIGRVLPQLQLGVIQGWGVSGIAEWTRRLWQEQQSAQVESAHYRLGGVREVLRHQVVGLEDGASSSSAFRHGGTYLITGGLGGLGYLVAQHLAKQYSAQLVLMGRSGLDAGKEQRLRELRGLGAQVQYLSAEVSDGQQMRAVLDRTRELYGTLHGVIHAAGVGEGGSLLGRDGLSIAGVLSPKIGGTQRLSELLEAEPLDFICYFSSSSSMLGDFGSCDYSVGNRYELAHAKYVEDRAVAVCWPLWAEGGMKLEAQATQLYLRSSGLRELQSEAGIEVLERLLRAHRDSGLRHALVMVGERARVHRMLGMEEAGGDVAPGGDTPRSDVPRSSQSPSRRSGNRTALRGLTLEQSVQWELKEVASELLELPREQLEEQSNLAEFGFDSISLAMFARRLSERFGVEVLPSVFFSYPSLQKLTQYFTREHGEVLQARYAQPASRGTAQRREGRDVAQVRANVVRRGRRVRSFRNRRGASACRTEGRWEELSEPIAIIGMSGRFPAARTVEELWQILVEGREAVQEIPAERFDWRSTTRRPEAPEATSGSRQDQQQVAGAVPGVDEFDPLFFEISPNEAVLMDPRQRLLLQESFRALEDAGYGTRSTERAEDRDVRGRRGRATTRRCWQGRAVSRPTTMRCWRHGCRTS